MLGFGLGLPRFGLNANRFDQWLMENGDMLKDNTEAVAWAAPTGSTVETQTDMRIRLGTKIRSIDSATPVSMPSLTAGTDYAIYLCADGSLVASANFSAPDGWDAPDVRRIGGFHVAPGGNATANDGGNTTPAINPFSLWDLKWRPACPDPRGMVIAPGNTGWVDIYLCGVDHIVNGTSRNNVTIADGSAPPKIPLVFGGNGSTAYSAGTWWNFAEVMASHGKALVGYAEWCHCAWGVKENASRGNDPVTTGLGTTNAGSTNADEKFTSRRGLIQATGCVWSWADEFGGNSPSAAWTNTAGGRGQVYKQENAALLGGSWDSGGNSGSRASTWGDLPSGSYGTSGGRGRCDHLHLV